MQRELVGRLVEVDDLVLAPEEASSYQHSVVVPVHDEDDTSDLPLTPSDSHQTYHNHVVDASVVTEEGVDFVLELPVPLVGYHQGPSVYCLIKPAIVAVFLDFA